MKDRLTEIKGKIYGPDVEWLIQQLEGSRSDIRTWMVVAALTGVLGGIAGWLVGIAVGWPGL